jgi:hypothetical protein
LPPDERGLGNHIATIDRGGAAAGTQHRAENAQGSGFSCAVGSQQAVNLPRQRIEADMIESYELPAAQISIKLRELSGVNHGW